MQRCAKFVLNFSCARLILDIFVLLLPQFYCLETIYGREGENLTLVCPIFLPVNATKTSWRGPPSYYIYSINGEINPNIERRDRLSVIMNSATGIYSLVIKNLDRLEDEGTYSCIVTASSTVEQSFLNVAFYDIPSITVFQANQRKEVNESSPFGLICNVNSSSHTNMSIMNQETGEVVSDGVSADTLNFTETSAKCYQTAQYICKATNIAGSIISSPVQIFVNCRPRPLNGVYFQKLYVTLGSSIDLAVNVTGYPLPKPEWTLISPTNITNLNSLVETNSSLNISFGLYQLKKTSMKEDDFGIYTLHLTNYYGTFTSYFYVTKEVLKEGKPQNRSEGSTTVSLLSALVGVLFIVCISQLVYIVIWKVYQSKRKENSTFDKTGRGGDYVMQDITRIEDHQYQTITSEKMNKGIRKH